MPQLTDTRETKKIKLKTVAGGEAEVYTALLAGDVDRLNRAGALKQEGPHLIKIACACVKGWNLTDEKDAALEVNEENLGKLFIADLNEIVNEGLADFLPQATGANAPK